MLYNYLCTCLISESEDVIYTDSALVDNFFQREIPNFEEDDDEGRPDNDDEKPMIVQLREGDLTAEEVEELEKSQGVWILRGLDSVTIFIIDLLYKKSSV